MHKEKAKLTKLNSVVKISTRIKSHQAVLIIVLFIILLVGFLGYNKYLDYRNVNDMKTLLSDFQQLEKTIEAETGEEFYIQKDCSYNGEKFNQKLMCDLVLVPVKDGSNTSFAKLLTSSRLDKEYDCRIATGGLYESFIFCDLTHRPSTKNEINNLVK